MDTKDLTQLLDRLRAEPHETEWLEFKANRHEPEELGEYISALANAACLHGKSRGYLFVSRAIAADTGEKARHIRERGFDNQYYRDLLLALIREHGPVGPDQINNLLLKKLPDALDEGQKQAKARNLTYDLAHRRHLIVNIGSSRGAGARWVVAQTKGEAEQARKAEVDAATRNETSRK